MMKNKRKIENNKIKIVKKNVLEKILEGTKERQWSIVLNAN